MSEHLTAESFKEKVYDWEKGAEWKFEGDLPAIIDFYARWCGPCKMLGPLLEQIAEEFQGKLRVYKVDIDAEPELAAVFGVQSVPTMLFVPMEGKPAMALGALPKAAIERAVGEVLKVA